MKEKIDIDDSFEEKEKENETENKENEAENIENALKTINLNELKTIKTISCKEEDDCKNFQDKLTNQTHNILKRLFKI